MHTIEDLRERHTRALREAEAYIASISSDDLFLSTPCEGWDVAALLGHLVGQNDGFAAAIEHGDAPKSAYAPATVVAGEHVASWRRSADAVGAAMAAADLAVRIRLIEIGDGLVFALPAVVEIHLLDTVVHTWDVATALGRPYRPHPELVDSVAARAADVPGGAYRTMPGAAFAPARSVNDPDPWRRALAQLGRRPENSPSDVTSSGSGRTPDRSCPSPSRPGGTAP